MLVSDQNKMQLGFYLPWS